MARSGGGNGDALQKRIAAAARGKWYRPVTVTLATTLM
jgi:hypothetical protein